MNRHQKKVLSLAAAIANLSFTMAVAGVATYAWYTAQASLYKNVEEISIDCAIPESQITWEVLTYSDDEKAGVSSDDSSDYYLRPYDSVITKDNIHSNAILKAVIEVNNFTSNNDLVIDITCQDGHTPTTSSVPSYTSNICQFKSSIYSYVDSSDTEHVLNNSITPTSPDTRYQTATSFFDTNKTPGTRFVALHNSVPNKRYNKITLCPTLDCGEYTVKSITVYIECSYNKKLVNYFESVNSLSGTINLAGDITSFVFRSVAARRGSYVKVSNGTPLSTSGDYLITYDGYSTDDLNPALDGSGTAAPQYTSGQNFVDVYSRKNMIRNTEVTEASSFNYNTSTQLLTSHAGLKVGLTNSGTDNMYANSSGTYTNSLSYVSDHSKITSNNQNTKYIQFNTNSNGHRFGYYTSASSFGATELYKYDENADSTIIAEDLILQNGYKTTYYVGDAFESPTVYVQYSDNSTANVTSECIFTGFSSAAPGTYNITVTYTDDDDGITLTGDYQYTVSALSVTSIAVTTNPTKMSYSEGETFDPSGMVVTATYNSGATATVNNNDLTYKTTALNISDTPFQISYSGASTTLAITITYAPVYTYDLVTSSSTPLAAGEEVIFACNYATNDNYALKGEKLNNYYLVASSVTLTSNLSQLTPNSNSSVWTVGGTSGSYTFKNGDNYLYGYVYSNKQYVNFDTTLQSGTSWSISYGSTYSNVKSDQNVYLSHTVYNSTHEFTGNSSSQSNILIYRKTAHAPLSSISLSNQTTSYFVGDSFTAPTVTAHYADSTSATVTPTSITGYNMSTAGTQTVTVSYTETYADTSITKTAEYQITVSNPTLTSIAISGYTTSFHVGDTFSFGGTVTASYNHGSNKNVTANATFSGYNMSTTGNQTVTVSYTEGDVTKTATYQITVSQAVTTYTVTYSGNGNTSGSAPTDSNSPYASGSTVTVLGNTGNLAKTNYSFAGWNTASDGSGTNYSAGNTFTITGNITLYARWVSTYQHVFNAKPNTGNNITLSSKSWNITATNLQSYNSTNYAGVQFGTSKADGQITLTSSSSWTFNSKSTITEVRLWLNLGGTSVTPTVTIGGYSATSDGTVVVKNSSAGSDWTQTTCVTFTPDGNHNTGIIVIDVSSVKAAYICCLQIDCR